jgi:hypothetical protein
MLKTALVRISCIQNTQIRGETTAKVFGKVDTFWTYQYMRCILEGNEINGGELPFYHRHRGPARCFAHFCFVRSPRARLGKPRMACARRMDESPNPDENEEPGAWLGRIPPSGFKNGLPVASSGTRLEMLLVLWWIVC